MFACHYGFGLSFLLNMGQNKKYVIELHQILATITTLIL